MEWYLGVSFIIVVITICMLILSRFGTRSILDEIDKSRINRTETTLKVVIPMVKEFFGTILATMTKEGAKANEEVKTVMPRKRTVKKTEEEKAE